MLEASLINQFSTVLLCSKCYSSVLYKKVFYAAPLGLTWGMVKSDMRYANLVKFLLRAPDLWRVHYRAISEQFFSHTFMKWLYAQHERANKSDLIQVSALGYFLSSLVQTKHRYKKKLISHILPPFTFVTTFTFLFLGLKIITELNGRGEKMITEGT